MVPDLFISYSTKDIEIANIIRVALEKADVQCWMAAEDILPSEIYGQTIINAINTSHLVILIFTSNANESKHVLSEIDRAYNKKKPIILFRVQDVSLSDALEYYLSTASWLNALDPPIERHLQKLIKTVKLLLSKTSQAILQETIKPESARTESKEFLPSSTTAGFVGITERGPTHPTLVTSWEDYKQMFGEVLNPDISFLPLSIRGFFENGGQRAFVARIAGKDSSKAGADLPFPHDKEYLHIQALYPGSWGNRVFVRCRNGTRTGYRLTIFYYRTNPSFSEPIMQKDDLEPDLHEDYDNLSLKPDGPNNLQAVVNSSSKLVRVLWGQKNQPAVTTINGLTQLTGGSDGSGISASDYTGDTSNRSEQSYGLAALESVEEISLICIPDQVHCSLEQADQQRIMDAMIDQCERLRDRFAILSVCAGERDVEVINSPRDTSYAAVYYPWLRVLDPYTKSGILIPPVGHIAGIYAQNDARRGVHTAPINLPVRGIIKKSEGDCLSPLEFEVSTTQQDILNRKGINVIQNIGKDNYDIRVTTAYTISIDYNWRCINVRRFINYLIEAITRGTNWVIYEQNNESLWDKVGNAITEFLTGTWEEKALNGSTPDEAFFVKCDRTTMTGDDIDNGRLICMIGVTLVEPKISIVFEVILKTATDLR